MELRRRMRLEERPRLVVERQPDIEPHPRREDVAIRLPRIPIGEEPRARFRTQSPG